MKLMSNSSMINTNFWELEMIFSLFSWDLNMSFHCCTEHSDISQALQIQLSKINLPFTLNLHYQLYFIYLLINHHASNHQGQTQGSSQFLPLLWCIFYFSTQWSPASIDSTYDISQLTLFFIHIDPVLSQVISLLFLQCILT